MKLFSVINYTRTNGNITAHIAPNPFTSDIVIFPESDFYSFLDRHDKLIDQEIEITSIDMYFNETAVVHVLYDLYDYVLTNQIDIDHAMANTIFNIQQIIN
jgi:hypothetical protein